MIGVFIPYSRIKAGRLTGSERELGISDFGFGIWNSVVVLLHAVKALGLAGSFGGSGGDDSTSGGEGASFDVL
jgi:hypothetical protein